MDVLSAKEISELIVAIIGIGGLITTPLVALRTHFGLKGRNAQKDEAIEAFNRVGNELSSHEVKRNLAAAIKIRRFFTKEISEHSPRLRKEAINVISSLLRTLKTGVYQKTLADGLAYAIDLSLMDLQRINLQNAYVGHKREIEKKTRKTWRLRKSRSSSIAESEIIVSLVNKASISAESHMKICIQKTDFFLADLSYALFEYVEGAAYFCNAILCHTRFKSCDLSGSMFNGADLSHVYFKDVKLTGADFSGAINLPDDLGNKLLNGKYESDELFTSTLASEKPKRIFFSSPSVVMNNERWFKDSLEDYLKRNDFEIVPYTRDNYPQFGQIKAVAEKVKQSDGMIVFGFKQTLINDGLYRPETKDTAKWEKIWLPSPWNEIEVGMASMMDIPVLLIKDKDIQTGIFDQNLSETDIKTYVLPPKAESINWEGCVELDEFLSVIDSRYRKDIPEGETKKKEN